jgi:hypothetical protein
LGAPLEALSTELPDELFQHHGRLRFGDLAAIGEH